MKPYSEINILEFFSLKNEKFKIYADLKVFDFSDFELKEVKTLIQNFFGSLIHEWCKITLT